MRTALARCLALTPLLLLGAGCATVHAVTPDALMSAPGWSTPVVQGDLTIHRHGTRVWRCPEELALELCWPVEAEELTLSRPVTAERLADMLALRDGRGVHYVVPNPHRARYTVEEHNEGGTAVGVTLGVVFTLVMGALIAGAVIGATGGIHVVDTHGWSFH